MSLIQEALQRQQQELDNAPEDSATLTKTAIPISPQKIEQSNSGDKENKHIASYPTKKPMNIGPNTPPPPPTHARQPNKTDLKKESAGSPWHKLILVLIILFIIIATAAVMIFLAMKKLAGGQLKQVITTYSEKEKSIVHPNQGTAKPKPDTDISKQNPIKPEIQSTSLLQNIPKKLPAQTTTITVPRTKVKWPQLNVTATLAKGNVGQAIINGEFITVGEIINGVTLVNIRGNTVEFSYKNEKKFLKVGKTSP